MSSYHVEFEQQDVYHIGFVVDDVPSAVERWTKLYGAGPFFHFSNKTFDKLLFRGEPVAFSETAAYGKFGRSAVELQSFRFDTPNPDLQHLLGADRPNQMSHAGYLASDPTAASARLEALGIPMFMEGQNGENSFFWHDALEELGHFIEIFSDRQIVRLFHSAVESVAVGWDGSNPLRSDLPPELEAELGRIMSRD